MIYYRYEMPDGGGPFITRDGVLRADPSCVMNDNTLSVCDSVDSLNRWFSEREIPTNDLIVTAYKGNVVSKLKTGEILIAKDTSVKVR